MSKSDDMQISPNYRRGDFPKVLSRQDKIRIFEDRIGGWVLAPAMRLLAENLDSGFAALAIITTYFEMIAKYETGHNVEPPERTRGGRLFQDGIRHVFPQISDDVTKLYYLKVRNALYHAGFPTAAVAIDDVQPEAFSYDANLPIPLRLNPSEIVYAVQAHFAQYVAELKALDEGARQDNFERRFDLDNH